MADAQQEIEQARALAQQGKSEAGVALLSQLIQRDASNVAAWLALSDVVDDPERAEYCLQKVLTLDPGNAAATEKLSKAKGGSLSVGAVGSLFHDERPPEDDPVPAARTEKLQDTDSDETDRPEPDPTIPQAPADPPEPQGEIPAAEVPAREIAERSPVSRTDLILIGLTVLAGLVLCALVSAALIS